MTPLKDFTTSEFNTLSHYGVLLIAIVEILKRMQIHQKFSMSSGPFLRRLNIGN